MDTATVETTSTPATTTTDVATAAPATQETSSQSSTTGQRPTSMRAAFEQVAAAQDTPAVQPEAATTQPTAEATPDGATSPQGKQGPIPFDVHKTALENARVKEREAIERDLGWARQVPKEAIQQWSSIAQKMTSDPIAFLNEFTQELHAHPTFGPQLRTHAAKTLAAGRGQAAVDLNPDLVVDDGQGKQIATFSADRVKAIVDHAVQQAIAKEVQPLKSESEQRAAQAKAAESTRLANEKADSTMADIADILEITSPETPESQKLYGAVWQLMEQDKSLSAEKAARQVWKTHIRPTIESKGQAKALEQLKTKAAGNTANGTGAAATPKRPTNRRELAAYLAALGD